MLQKIIYIVHAVFYMCVKLKAGEYYFCLYHYHNNNYYYNYYSYV